MITNKMGYEEEKEALIRQINILIGENRALRELLGLNKNKHTTKQHSILIDFNTRKIIKFSQENI